MAEIELPKIVSNLKIEIAVQKAAISIFTNFKLTAKSLQLDIGEDCIKLTTRSSLYLLDIYLPYNLVQEECGAQFDRKTKVLTITMPVNNSC